MNSFEGIAGKVRKYLPETLFLKNVTVTSSGIILGQVVALLAMPVFGRVFSPAEVGHFAVLSSFVGVVVTILGLRLEQAITVSDNQHDSNLLFSAVCLISVPVSLMCSIIAFLFFSDAVVAWVMLALVVWMFSSIVLLSSRLWLQRHGLFNLTAKNQFLQISLISLCPILLSLHWGPTYEVLLISNVAVTMLIAVSLLVTVLRSPDFYWLNPLVNLPAILTYKNFVLYLVPGHLVNTLAANLPIFILSYGYGKDVAGAFQMSSQILFYPLAFVSQGIQQVYYPRICKEFNDSGNCRETTIKTARMLFVIALPVFALVYLFGQPLISLWLGAKWENASWIASALSMFVMIRFINAPISAVWLAAKKQKQDLIWQCFNLVLLGGALFIPVYSGMEWKTTILIYGVAVALSFGINLYLCVRYSTGSPVTSKRNVSANCDIVPT